MAFGLFGLFGSVKAQLSYQNNQIRSDTTKLKNWNIIHNDYILVKTEYQTEQIENNELSGLYPPFVFCPEFEADEIKVITVQVRTFKKQVK